MATASNHSRIVVVGSRGSGKSSFVATVSGIYLGTATACPVEWHLSPSVTWAATVSVAYHYPTFSSSAIDKTLPYKVGTMCSTPGQLQLLLKRAELMTFYPGITATSISLLSDDTITAALASTSTSLSGGVIYVDLQCPEQISQEITIVDMPGIPDAAEAGGRIPRIFIKQLIHSYARSEKTMVAMILPISDLDSENHSEVLSFVKSIRKGLVRTTIIFNHLEVAANSPLLPKALHPSQCFYVNQPDLQVPFACSSSEIQRLRQDEAAFFQFCKPWSSEVERDNLGVVNVLKAWSVLHNKLESSPEIVYSRRGPIATCCVWLLSSVVVILAMAFLQYMYKSGLYMYSLNSGDFRQNGKLVWK